METETLERPPEAVEEEPQEPDSPQEPAAAAETGEELYMEGDERSLSTDVGGKQPTDSKLQIVGKSVSIEGQVEKGKRIRATVELEVGAVKFQDSKDGQTGQIVASTRTHYASIVGFAREQ